MLALIQPYLNALTPREKVLVSHVVAGLTNRQIAQRLGLSFHAVHNRLSIISQKLGVSGRTQLAVYALTGYKPAVYQDAWDA